MKKIVLYFIILFTFGIGGTLQFLGILSNTITTALLTVLALIPVILHISTYLKVKFDLIHLTLSLFGLLIIISGLWNGTNVLLMTLYFLVIIVPYALHNLLTLYLNQATLRKIMMVFIYIGLLQLPVMLIQSIVAKTAIKFSARPIAYYDFKFGTFFLANDHALSFFVVGLITFILFNPNSQQIIKNKNFTLVWLCITVFLSNSKISYLILILVLGIYFIRYITVKQIIYGLIFSFLSIGIVMSTSIRHVMEQNLTGIYDNFNRERTISDSRKIYKAGLGGRKIILQVWLDEPLRIIGEGPNTYFNPITKKFDNAQIYGQILWIYYDLGLAGVILSLLLIVVIAMKYRTPESKYIYLLLVIFIIYAFMNNVLYDIASMLSYLVFLASAQITPTPNQAYNKELEYEPS